MSLAVDLSRGPELPSSNRGEQLSLSFVAEDDRSFATEWLSDTSQRSELSDRSLEFLPTAPAVPASIVSSAAPTADFENPVRLVAAGLEGRPIAFDDGRLRGLHYDAVDEAGRVFAPSYNASEHPDPPYNSVPNYSFPDWRIR